MSQPSLAQSRTVALPFVRLVQDHPHLFQVNPGVDASLALEHASLFLAAAYDMEYFHCDSNETLDAELDRFLACDKACLMVCEVDSHNNTK